MDTIIPIRLITIEGNVLLENIELFKNPKSAVCSLGKLLFTKVYKPPKPTSIYFKLFKLLNMPSNVFIRVPLRFSDSKLEKLLF